MPKQVIPPCPRCNTAKKSTVAGLTGDTFHCGRCGGLYDNEPDEGGSHSDRNPAARLERQERNRGSTARR